MNRKIIIPNGGEAIKAEYKEQLIQEYSGNPLIEALPQISSKIEVIDKLSVYPKYDDKERILESHYRVHLVQRLFQCFQPLEIHLDIESRLSRVIRQSYLARNPFRPEFASGLQDGYRMIQNLSLDLTVNSSFRTTAAGFSIVGVSGMGKTTAVNRILSMIPQIIVHSKYKENNFSIYQLVWLKLDCPYDGSIRGLCMEFFNKVDSLLGTKYYQKHINGRHTVDTMLSVMSQIARSIGLGLLIIDEIQHLKQAKSGGSERMLNFFVTLVNTIGVPVVLIGTMKALSLLQGEFRQARRGSGQGDLTYERLKQDDNWELLLSALWDYQWTKTPVFLTSRISNMMYEHSQGIIDIAVKLYAMAQIRAILSGSELVDEALIRQVAEENFKLVKPMIEALKSGDIRRIAQFEDICPINFEEFISLQRPRYDLDINMKELQLLKKRKKEAEENKTSREKAIMKLIELEIDTESAETAIAEVITIDGESIGTGELVIKALQKIADSEKRQKKKQRKKKDVKARGRDDIRAIVEEDKHKQVSAYTMLKEKGYIKHSDVDCCMEGKKIC
ncbi:ATP-binding protein [Clostridium formicaceticum]|uniref:AAA family ATPase n=1 Tax=Clostridium formicaceticum TaxID=1497 RepID=A0AAC9RQN2_9CLOT|nr:ATP-binding protein [Clostridium formicaceticum]AOY74997.1 AAA family ATPase [Clostridium formicaceticum]ARE89410.1 Transposon Tn7 transposition protein TnsC [Clostridium formicaceticum]